MTRATCTNVFEYLTTIGTMNKNGTKRLPTKYSLRIRHLLIMQNFRANEQPILREMNMIQKEKKKKYNSQNSGPLVLPTSPKGAHRLRSDKYINMTRRARC